MRPIDLAPLSIPEYLRYAALGLWIGLVVAISVASLLPHFGPPSAFNLDKILHTLGYAGAAGLPFLAFLAGRRVYGAALCMAPLGLILEGLQHFVPSRASELGDAIANVSGVAIGILLGPLARAIASRWFGRVI
jgi:VanZ family protein